MNDEKIIMKCQTIFSDDRKHRYVWFREWDKTKPTATIIMISPGQSDNVTSDLTTMLCVNNCYDLGFGSVYIVNLYSLLGITSGGRVKLTEKSNADTDKYIRAAVEKSETVILAWGSAGSSGKEIEGRVKAVEQLLSSYDNKLYLISDGKYRTGLHPLFPGVRKGWELTPYPIQREEKQA